MQLSIFNLSPTAIFFSLGFRASVHKPPTATSLRSLFCWWAQMDSNHRPNCLRNSFGISNAFGLFACVSRQTNHRTYLRYIRCFVGGLKWTRTIDLTLIRRVL